MGFIADMFGGGNVKAAKDAAKREWAQYLQSREDLAPWRESGATAVKSLADKVAAGPGELTKSPGYQFRLDEGTRALNRSAAARGTLGSGAQQKNLLRYGQNYATNEYDNFLNRYYQSLTPLQSLSGLGLTSTGQTAQLGANAVTNMNRNNQQAAAARSSAFDTLGNIALFGIDQWNLNSLNKNSGSSGSSGLSGNNYGMGNSSDFYGNLNIGGNNW